MEVFVGIKLCLSVSELCKMSAIADNKRSNKRAKKKRAARTSKDDESQYEISSTVVSAVCYKNDASHPPSAVCTNR